MLLKTWFKAKGVYSRYVKNETGAQSLEWVALGLVVIAVMGAIATVVQKDQTLGATVVSTLNKMIQGLSQ